MHFGICLFFQRSVCASVPTGHLFLDHFWAFHGFWAWFAGVSRRWNEASSAECYVAEHHNTMFLSQALDLILWTRLQGSVLTRLSAKTLLCSQLSGGRGEKPLFRKNMEDNFFGWSWLWVLEGSYYFWKCWKFQSSEPVKCKFIWSHRPKMDAIHQWALFTGIICFCVHKT